MSPADAPALVTPDLHTLRQAPELAALNVLDAALVGAHLALGARHRRLYSARSTPSHSDDETRVAAAVVAAIDALRYLLAEYDCAVHTALANELPF
jgi:hypothetical protein